MARRVLSCWVALACCLISLLIVACSARHLPSLAAVSDSAPLRGGVSSAPQQQKQHHEAIIAAVSSLIKRNFPGVASSNIVLQLIDPDNATGMDVFELGDGPTSGTVVVRGSSATALSQGVGHYMRYYAHTQISWTGDQMQSLLGRRTLPPVVVPVRAVATSRWSYYLNTCTFSYSAVWWDWRRWEREIDWMALNGINLPLAFTGQEYVWRLLFKEFGCSDDELLAQWFTGPAFLAWFRMGNLQGWGGPLPLEWIERQKDLQVLILARMRELGMTPVLPMFAGFVPQALAEHFPGAKMTRSHQWNWFNDTYRTWILEATDPLFIKIGTRFLELQDKVYGHSHFYSADTYNEMLPSSSDVSYLAASSGAVYDAMSSFDPDGSWILQGWLFHNDPQFWHAEQIKAYLSGVPDDHMIVLDLFTDFNPVWSETQSYFGKKWIWCLLHNFGGEPGMWGDLNRTLQQPHIDRRAAPATFAGIGLTMEAIGHNYIMYEALLEARWRDPPPNVNEWVEGYVERRYGEFVHSRSALREAKRAWLLIADTVYRSPYHNISSIELRPAFKAELLPASSPRSRTYKLSIGSVDNLWDAWSILLSADVVRQASHLETYRNDIVIVGREILSNLLTDALRAFGEAFKTQDGYRMRQMGSAMLELIGDIDALLLTDGHQLLGKWLADAHRWGVTPEQSALLDFNARNQLTNWGPAANINDYARKPWSGLYSSYYLPRWKLFIDSAVVAARRGKGHFLWDEFIADCSAFERSWQADSSSSSQFPTEPRGDTVRVARWLQRKYRRLF